MERIGTSSNLFSATSGDAVVGALVIGDRANKRLPALRGANSPQLVEGEKISAYARFSDSAVGCSGL